MFSYQDNKQGKLFLLYHGKTIKILKDLAAQKLLQHLHAAKNEEDVQLLLAKATGNFKRGNEKLAKLKR